MAAGFQHPKELIDRFLIRAGIKVQAVNPQAETVDGADRHDKVERMVRNVHFTGVTGYILFIPGYLFSRPDVDAGDIVMGRQPEQIIPERSDVQDAFG